MKKTMQRVVRFGLQNYFRNGWLSLAATLVVAMTLFIVSVFTLQSYVTRTTAQSIQDKLDMSVYLADGPAEEAVTTFVSQIKAYPDVREVVYLNKQQVIDEWNKLYFDQKIKSQVNEANNPLPRTIKIKAHDPQSLDAIAERITTSDFSANIRNMSYKNNRPLIQQLIEKSNKTSRNGIIVSSIFIVIAVLFVYNTIRIIIRFRQDEISVMKLVGATDSFVRGPFMVEGTLYGVVAGILSMVALYFYLQNGLSETTASLANPDTVVSEQLFVFFQAHMLSIGTILVLLAIMLATSCSWLSVRNHLKR